MTDDHPAVPDPYRPGPALPDPAAPSPGSATHWTAPARDYEPADPAAPSRWADADAPAAVPPPIPGINGPHTRPGWLMAGRPDDAA